MYLNFNLGDVVDLNVLHTYYYCTTALLYLYTFCRVSLRQIARVNSKNEANIDKAWLGVFSIPNAGGAMS